MTHLTASVPEWFKVERTKMNCYLHLLLVSLLTSTSCGASKRMYLNYTGDIMVGALFPIHRKGSNGTECGRIQMEDGVQPLEAMIFTLNQINNDPKILPGIKLGMLAFDSCDSQSYGLEQSLNFVKGKLSPTYSLPSSVTIQVNYHQHTPCPAQSPSRYTITNTLLAPLSHHPGKLSPTYSLPSSDTIQLRHHPAKLSPAYYLPSSVTIQVNYHQHTPCQLRHHPGKLSPTHSLPISDTIQLNYHQHTPCPAQSPSSSDTIQLNYHQHTPCPAQSPSSSVTIQLSHHPGKLSPAYSLPSSDTIQLNYHQHTPCPAQSPSSSVTIQVNYHQHTPPSSVTIQVNYHQHTPCPAQSPSSWAARSDARGCGLIAHVGLFASVYQREAAILVQFEATCQVSEPYCFFAHFNEFHEHEFQCNDGSTPKFRGGGFDQVVSVIGAQSSSVTIQVATMLRLFRVPLVSYMATSTSLSNKERFPYFFRTVPSDINQAHAMLEILRRFNWTYVSVVYSDNEYGNHGFETLSSLASNYSICFTAPQRIDKEHFDDKDFDQVSIGVVVVFAEKITMFNLLDSARRTGYESRFVWIGSDAWVTSGHREPRGLQHAPDEEHLEESVLEGALAIQPLVQKLIGFDEYFKSLTLDHEKENPWFREYWREYFKCGRKQRGKEVLGHASKSTIEESEDYCMTSNKNLSHGGYKQQRYLHFVRDAVYSVAHALHDLQVYLCGAGKPGVCDRMKHIDGETLHGYLHNVSFNDEGGRLFKFLDGRDGPLRYSILNFQKDLNGSYKWNVVGNYTQSENGLPMLKIDQKAITYRRNESGIFPKSTCTQSCEVHQIKVRELANAPVVLSQTTEDGEIEVQISTDDTCCWQCRSCGEFQRKSNDHKCSECPSGTRPNPDHSVCVDIPEEFIDFHDPWAIGAMAVASLGVLLTVFVALIFWTYSDTPVIKASGRELSYLLLLGTLASFCMTFVIVSRPTSFTCGLTRFFLGFCYTLCYAAIVTKTNRIARIFNNTAHSPHKTRYTSPQSQLVITALLTLVEVVINVTWLMYVPPRVIHVYPDRGSRVLICDGLKDHSYFVGLLYPFVLIGLCTAYAIKTRKCPGGFNETRHIAFTNYTTIIIWLAFVPLYLASTSNSIRIVTLAISLSLGSLIQDSNLCLLVNNYRELSVNHALARQFGRTVAQSLARTLVSLAKPEVVDNAPNTRPMNSGLVQLGCLFFPKLYIVLFKPEKNTKEVVMSQHRSTVYLSTPSNLTPVVVVNGGTHYVQSAGVMNVDATEVAKKGRSNTGSGISLGGNAGQMLSALWSCLRRKSLYSLPRGESTVCEFGKGVPNPPHNKRVVVCTQFQLGMAGHDTSTRSPLGKLWQKPWETEAIPKAPFLTLYRRNKPSLKEVMTTTKTSPDLVQGGHTKDDAFAEEAPKSQIRTM
uniref:G-protein coupled receptors family 3 profile domain-containing protein n=2 Tax=Timema TaxID=61471 RepID=A0A7R9I354_9NEOP|nr:unnamed protein product [Timema bartmani]